MTRNVVLNDGDEVEEEDKHYKIVSISMYKEDIEALTEQVKILKSKGMTKATKSGLIRAALKQMDLEKVSKSAFDKRY